MTNATPACQLGYDPTKGSPKDNPARCAPEDCPRCGWNPEEAARRNAMALTLHPDGLKGLVIPGRGGGWDLTTSKGGETEQ